MAQRHIFECRYLSSVNVDVASHQVDNARFGRVVGELKPTTTFELKIEFPVSLQARSALDSGQENSRCHAHNFAGLSVGIGILIPVAW